MYSADPPELTLAYSSGCSSDISRTSERHAAISGTHASPIVLPATHAKAPSDAIFCIGFEVALAGADGVLLRFVAITPEGSVEVVNRQDWLHAGFPVTCVTFSEDGQCLAVASYDHTLAIWSTCQLCPREDTEDEDTGDEEDMVLPWSTKLPSSAERVGSLAFAPTSSQVSY